MHTKKMETEKEERKKSSRRGGLGGSGNPAKGMADQRQQVAASCKGSDWKEEQVLSLGWEERLHLPHG